jgi:hypothetical protein
VLQHRVNPPPNAADATLAAFLLTQGSRRIRGDGHTHDASALEVERDVDGRSIQAIELDDGIAGGGEETKWLHSGPGSPQPID